MLERFETFLQLAPRNQRLMIFAMPFMLVGALVWYLILPMQEERIDTLSQEITQLQHNIKRASPARLRSKIARTKKELLALRSRYERDRDDLNYLYARLSNLEIGEFDAKKWTITLDAILKESLKLGITLENIKNSDAGTKKKGAHKKVHKMDNIIAKKYVEISGSGTYDKAVRYLAFIEDSGFLIDVKNIRMDRSDKEIGRVDFTIDFTIYGVQL